MNLRLEIRTDIEFDKKVKELIDGLKAVCSVYG